MESVKMVVILDEKAIRMVKKFNYSMYYNIEGIMNLLLCSLSVFDIEEVMILGKDKYNQLEVICGKNSSKFQLSIENGSDIFDDCLRIGNSNNYMKFGFYTGKDKENYSLKLLEVCSQIKNSCKVEINFNGYGNHINVYKNSHIYSYDIQGKSGIFDADNFLLQMGNMEIINLETVLLQLQSCICDKEVVRILADEYYNCRLVKSKNISNHQITKARVLKFRGNRAKKY